MFWEGAYLKGWGIIMRRYDVVLGVMLIRTCC